MKEADWFDFFMTSSIIYSTVFIQFSFCLKVFAPSNRVMRQVS